MTVLEIRVGEYVDTEPVEAEPGCIRPEPDSAVFQNYLLARMKGAPRSDEASTEVLASVRAGRSFGDAVLDTIESLPESKTQKLRTWVQEARATRIYAYVEFYGLYRLSYGLRLTAGGPRDEVLATEQIGSQELENPAPYWEFRDALKEIQTDAARGDFASEIPLVEVSDKGEYDEALEAMDIPPRDGAWKRPGLYDFQESPPTYSGTVEDYERESMKYEAEQAFDAYFQDDDAWREVCETLLQDE